MGKIKIQQFRTNDLVDDNGKQIEFGKTWTESFFKVDSSVDEVILNLTFKAITLDTVDFDGKSIILKLAGVTGRSDRKAYANGNNGRSQLKDFFLSDLGLSVVDNNSDYFALYQINDRDYFLYYIPNLLYNNFIKFFESSNTEVSVSRTRPESFVGKDAVLPLQQIFYGAPGTGKSHRIDGKTNDDNSIRTTFHPDTDYATFVGAYKPMMEETEVRVVPVVLNNGASFDQNNGTYKEKRIVYKYEPQVFLKAYVEAWKRFLTKQEGEDDSFYLVIEEINRGNCAQIFGDLFQLLDREDDGFSGYAISPESAITKYLAEEAQSADGTKFSDLVFSDVIKKRKDGATKIIATADDLKAGKRLVLPPNLHIWATMNTSDQSLFPIDSAFKRRWDWEYVPIKRADKEPENKWIIKVTHGGKTYWCYWWEFLEAINHQIEETTHSEDKQLGYFFAKPKNGEDFISTDTFVNKVIFYLWNDVFKDEDSAVFQYDNNKVEDVSINRSGTMYFRHFMENKDEMIHYFINQLFAMGKDSTPVVPIDYLKNDADSKVIEHLPKMREGDPVKLDDEAVDEETSEDNGISVRKSDNIDKIVFSIPEYKKMSEKLTQALKGNVFKYSKNSMDMKMGDMPISYARLSMAYSSKKTDIKLYIPSKSAYNQSIECYKYMNSKGVEDIIAEVSERNNLEYELISKDIAENKVLGWRIKYPMTFSESADNIMDGDVTKIVEIVKELQKRITPIMNEFSKNGK